MADRASVNITERQMLKKAICQRDRVALEFLHKRYYISLKRYVSSRVGSLEDIEDLVQDVFIEIYKENKNYKGCDNVEKYLIGIAKNLVRQYYRKNTKSAKTIPIIAIKEPSENEQNPKIQDSLEQILSSERKRIIEKVVAQLPPKAREAIKLRFIDNMNSKEAAQKANCSSKTFRDRLNYAITELRKESDSLYKQLSSKK